MISSTRSENTVDESILKDIYINPRKMYSAKMGCNLIQTYKIDCDVDDSGDIKIFVEAAFQHLPGIDDKIENSARHYLENNEDMITVFEEALQSRPVNMHYSKTFKRIKSELSNNKEITNLCLFNTEEIVLNGLGVSLDADTKEVVSFSKSLVTKQLNTVSYDLEDNVIFKNDKFENKNNIIYFYDKFLDKLFEIKDTGALVLLNTEIEYDLKDILNQISELQYGEVRQYLFNNLIGEVSQSTKRKSIADSFSDIVLF